jgi:plastocyanin
MPRTLASLAAAVAALGLLLAAPALAGGGSSVAVRDNVFAPTTKTIRKGQTVTWVWRGQAPHNVVKTSGPGARFQSRLQTRGTYRRKFTRAGTYRLLCTVHAPSMKMKVVVR